MKIIVIGANGTIGKAVSKRLEQEGHELIKVGKSSGQYQVSIEDPKSVAELYRKIGSFDAVVNASGDLAFAPFADITQSQWELGLSSKLMGQVNLVQQALPFIRENGSFTLVSGVLSDEPIFAGVAATMVNKALEGFVQAVAFELPKGLRINLVSPTVLEESLPAYGAFFKGFVPTSGARVADAYLRSVAGIQTGRVYAVK